MKNRAHGGYKLLSPSHRLTKTDCFQKTEANMFFFSLFKLHSSVHGQTSARDQEV